jgi:hypothetical protein
MLLLCVDYQGSVMEAIIQVGGRNIFLFIMLDAEPRMQDKVAHLIFNYRIFFCFNVHF